MFVRSSLAALLTLCGWLAFRGEAAPSPQEQPVAAVRHAGPDLETMKGLIGEWCVADAEGRPSGEVMTRFRLTSNGSAILEELFPGTANEMVTVYHMDGKELVCTHYCGMGNQPFMKAAGGEKPGTLVFECVRLSNAASMQEAHMHKGVYVLKDADHFSVEWSSRDHDKDETHARFDFARKAK